MMKWLAEAGIVHVSRQGAGLPALTPPGGRVKHDTCHRTSMCGVFKMFAAHKALSTFTERLIKEYEK